MSSPRLGDSVISINNFAKHHIVIAAGYGSYYDSILFLSKIKSLNY